MPHPTDGELHMVLDGAADLLGEERARRVRAHLRECDECAARLRREREVRRASEEILDGAAPAVDDLASFEELADRARARAGGGGGPASDDADGGREGTSRSRIRTLSWAASVVLALGVGWVAGRTPGPGPAADRPAPSAADAAELGVAEGPDEPPVDVGSTGSTGSGDAARADAVGPGPAEASSGPVDALPGSGAVAAAEVARTLAVPGLPVLSVAWEEGPRVRIRQALPSGDTLELRYALAPEATGGAAAGTAALDDLVGGADTEAAAAPAPEEAQAERARAEAPRRAGRESAAEVQRAGRLAEERSDSVEAGDPSVVGRIGPWILEAGTGIPADSLRRLLEGLPRPPD